MGQGYSLTFRLTLFSLNSVLYFRNFTLKSGFLASFEKSHEPELGSASLNESTLLSEDEWKNSLRWDLWPLVSQSSHHPAPPPPFPFSVTTA